MYSMTLSETDIILSYPKILNQVLTPVADSKIGWMDKLTDTHTHTHTWEEDNEGMATILKTFLSIVSSPVSRVPNRTD